MLQLIVFIIDAVFPPKLPVYPLSKKAKVEDDGHKSDGGHDSEGSNKSVRAPLSTCPSLGHLLIGRLHFVRIQYSASR